MLQTLLIDSLGQRAVRPLEEPVAEVVVVEAVQPDVAVLTARHKTLAIRVVRHCIDRPKVSTHLQTGAHMMRDKQR